MTTHNKVKTGRVYSITNLISKRVYVGSTFKKLWARFLGHKRTHEYWLQGKTNFNWENRFHEDVSVYGWYCYELKLISEHKIVDQGDRFKNQKHLKKYEGIEQRKISPDKRLCSYRENPSKEEKAAYRPDVKARRKEVRKLKKEGKWDFVNRREKK